MVTIAWYSLKASFLIVLFLTVVSMWPHWQIRCPNEDGSNDPFHWLSDTRMGPSYWGKEANGWGRCPRPHVPRSLASSRHAQSNLSLHFLTLPYRRKYMAIKNWVFVDMIEIYTCLIIDIVYFGKKLQNVTFNDIRNRK